MVRESQSRSYAGVSAEERSASRRTKLLNAGRRLAAEGGRAAVTVRAICRESGLNQRYFYEHFANVDELLAASFDLFVESAMRSLTEPIDAKALSAYEGTRLIMERVVPFFEAAGPGSEEALSLAFGSDAFAQRRAALTDQAVEIVAVGIEHLPGRGDRGPVATRIVARIIVGGLVEALTAWSAGHLEATREEMVEYCTAAAIAAANTTGTGR